MADMLPSASFVDDAQVHMGLQCISDPAYSRVRCEQSLSFHRKWPVLGAALTAVSALILVLSSGDGGVVQQELAEQRALLEKAVQPHPGLWAALAVPEPIVPVDRIADIQLHFALVNDASKPLDPKPDSWRLVINGKPYPDSDMLFGNGPRDGRWKSLPPGDHLDFGYRLGEVFKKPGIYTISWRGEGFESRSAILRVVENRAPAKP